MVSALRQNATSGQLERITPEEIDHVLDALMDHEWVVYTKAYLQQADTLVRYLARYSHRTALSDSRLIDLSDSRVGLRYKDYRDGQHQSDGIGGGGIDPAVFITRITQRVYAHPPLRISGQSLSCD